MTRILLVGYAPEAVDFSDPALPPGMNAEKIAAGIEVGLRHIRERGWEGEFCSVRMDDDAPLIVKDRLRSTSHDCVVIGGGIRLSSKGLVVFEAIVNAVRETAPHVPIAFNTRPEDSAEAAARWVIP